MTRQFSINKAPYSIRCIQYSDDSAVFDQVVVCCHGFAGHKGNAAVRRFAEYALAKHRNLAVLCFDLPCHGEDVRRKLHLEDCIGYLDTVIRYANTEMAAKGLNLYGTSFGGYLTLKYVSDRGNPFRKIALRCPAVNMYEVISHGIMTEGNRELLHKGKTAETGFDRKIPVDAGFLAALRTADIAGLDYRPWAKDMMILHGTKDEIVSFDFVKFFAEANGIDFIAIDKADHRFVDPGRMREAILYVDAFFDYDT